MKKTILVLLGVICTVLSILAFSYGCGQYVLAGNPPEIEITNPNIIIAKPFTQNDALSIIIFSAIFGILGIITTITGFSFSSQSQESETEESEVNSEESETEESEVNSEESETEESETEVNKD